MKLPQFVLVEGETAVKIYAKTGKIGSDISGITASGKDYPPLKAMSEGKLITQEEFNRLSKAA